MKVKKRDGRFETVKPDKIFLRIKKLTYGLNPKFIEPFDVAKKVYDGLYDGVSSEELDKLAAETAASMSPVHPDYSILAARIEITRLKNTLEKGFFNTLTKLYNFKDSKTSEAAGMISDEVYKIAEKYKDELEEAIIHDRDFNYDYFGFKTLERSYLLKIDGKIAETPQQMLMRVSIGIHGDDLENIIKTYDLMSEKFMTHATPTLFNAGTKTPQMSSCFLLQVQDDSIDGIFESLKQCAKISKTAGGIGISWHNVRASGSYIKGTNGNSNGIIPFLKVFNETARAVDQCFTEETLIETNGGFKQIKDLNKDDLVKTSNNSFNKITKTKQYEYTGQLIKINNINVTPEHPFLVVRDCKNKAELEIKTLLKNGVLVPEWIEAKNLLTTDKILKY